MGGTAEHPSSGNRRRWLRWLLLAACIGALIWNSPSLGNASGDAHANCALSLHDATAAPASIDEYLEILEQALGKAEKAQKANAADRDVLSSEAAKLVAAAELVDRGDGVTISINNKWLLGYLNAKPPKLDAAVKDLRVLIAEIKKVRSLKEPAWSKNPEDALKEVLSAKKYRWGENEEQSDLQKAIQSLKDWIGDGLGDLGKAINDFFDQIGKWLRDLFGQSRTPEIPGPEDPMILGETWPLVVAAVVLMLAAIGLVFFMVLKRNPRPPKPPSDLPPEEEVEAVQTTNEALALANRYAQEGNFRIGIRALYLGSLLHLHEKRVIFFDRSLTNREHLHAVTYLPDVHRQFKPLVDTFDTVWYGHQSPTETEFKNYADEVERLRRTVQ